MEDHARFASRTVHIGYQMDPSVHPVVINMPRSRLERSRIIDDGWHQIVNRYLTLRTEVMRPLGMTLTGREFETGVSVIDTRDGDAMCHVPCMASAG